MNQPHELDRPATTAQDRERLFAGEGCDAEGKTWSYGQARAFIDRWAWSDVQPIVIVLTVAHLNHQPENLCA